jgi:iron complex transport system substrate-binding protein
MRIASLLPSATEIVYALGLEADLAGVTFECDFPPDPRAGRPVLVGGLDTHGLEPAAIDALVRAKIAAGDDLYRLDEDAFCDIDPTLVLTQDLCRVCALPAGEASAALDRLGCSAEVLTLDPHTLDEVLSTIVAVGIAAGVVASRPKPNVFVLEWSDPPFIAGHWVPDLVTAAGGTPVHAERGGRSVPTDWATIAAADPDIVVVSPCGFKLDAAAEQAAAAIAYLPERAAVWAIDADGLMVRPGPRVVDGVEALASIFHPDLVPEASDTAVRRIR